MADNRATIEIGASSRGLDADLRASRRKWQIWAKGVGKDIDSVTAELKASRLKQEREGKSKGGARDSFLGNFGANIATRGLDMVVDAAKSTLSYEKAMTRFQVNANASTESLIPFRKAVADASGETSIARDEVLAAAQAYGDISGNYTGAATAVRSFARAAQASNTAIEDVARTGAVLQTNLNISPEEMETAFSALISEGKAGSVTMADLAQHMSSVAAASGKFADSGGIDGLRRLGAALQVVAKDTGGDMALASTNMKALYASIGTNAPKLQKAGISLLGPKDASGVRHYKSIDSIIASISKSKLMKDPIALQKAFGGNVQALAALNSLIGRAKEYQSIYDSSKDAGVVARDLSTVMNSPAMRMEATWNRIKLTVAGIFTPERIEAFASALETMLGKLGSMFETMSGMAHQLDVLIKGEGDDDIQRRMWGERRDRRRLQRQWMFGESEGQADANMLKEDIIDAAVRSGNRLAPDQRIENGKVLEGYNVGELAKFGAVANRQGFSNKGTFVPYTLAPAIKRRMAEETQATVGLASGLDKRLVDALGQLTRALQQQQVNIHVGNEKVATATREGTPRSRTGGH
jgi:TP901 family phage tail tape measure protein